MRTTHNIFDRSQPSTSNRHITQDALCDLLIKLINKSRTRSDAAAYGWREILEEAGYVPEFCKINFDILRQQIIMRAGESGLVLVRHMVSDYSGVDFTSCTNIWLLRGSRFYKCRFFDCDLAGFIDCTLVDCEFTFSNFIQSSIQRCVFDRVAFYSCLFNKSKWSEITSHHIKMTTCTITRSLFINIVEDNISGFINGNNTFDGATVFQNTPFDHVYYRRFSVNNLHTNMVVLYSPNDGTIYCDELINFLREKGMNVILITPELGFNHPVFSFPQFIHGVVLPGGPDVPKDDDARKTFEKGLVDYASKHHHIPVLGICRGHQLIGSMFGGMIVRQPHTKARETEIIVKDKPSILADVIEKKFNKYQERADATRDLIKKNADGRFVYQSQCAHWNVVFFPKGVRDKKRVMVTAKSSDGMIEAMQIDEHILTFQHHHEAYWLRHTGSAKVARAVLNAFVKMAKAKHDAIVNVDLKEQPASSSLSGPARK